MADITVTAANVAMGASTLRTRVVQVGEAVTQGQPGYLHTDSKYYQTDADVAASSVAAGVFLTAATTNGYALLALPDSEPGRALVNLGATLAVGTVYAVSATKGGIAPIADLASGDYITVLGVAVTAALLDLQIVVSNVAKA